ncbi:hypothetical protein [Cystobacter fuscus]|nr:hypothetical protein [Cystobacter fuscus]
MPDGRKYLVFIVLGDRDGRIAVEDGFQAGAFILNWNVPVRAVWRWP